MLLSFRCFLFLMGGVVIRLARDGRYFTANLVEVDKSPVF